MTSSRSTCADLSHDRSIGELLAEGLARIPSSRTQDVYSQLETRDLSAQEQNIIDERVALQRKLLEEYEKRELRRKETAVADVFPSLDKRQISALIKQHPREEDAIAAYAANPGILAALGVTNLSEVGRGNQSSSDLHQSQAGDTEHGADDLPEIPRCISKRRRSARVRPHSSTSQPWLSSQEQAPPGECSSGEAGQSRSLQPAALLAAEDTLPRLWFQENQNEILPSLENGAKAGPSRQEAGLIAPASNGEKGDAGSSEDHDAGGKSCSHGGKSCKILQHAMSSTQHGTAPAASGSNGSNESSLEGRLKRPRRRAADGVAHLVKALQRRLESYAAESSGKRRRPRPAKMRRVAGTCSLPPAPEPTELVSEALDAPPARKPRLGRVKKCSTKAVDLLAIGRLRPEPGWFNKGYIFPDGFKSCTPFRSSEDVKTSCRHVCSIVGEEGEFWPLPTFMIQADDCDRPVVAKSATGAWSAILARINASITARRKAGENLPPPPGTAIPGPEFFGLTSPYIVGAVEQLDPGRKCTSYWQGKTELMLFVRAHGSEPVKRDLDTPRARKTSHRAWNSDEDTSEEDEEDIVYADDDEAASDAEVPSNRWSAVDRALRLRGRQACEAERGDDDQSLLPGVVDPITLQRIASPAASPSGHVMGLATWAAVLGATGHCPFTQQPLQREQLTLLTPANIDRLRGRLILSSKR